MHAWRTGRQPHDRHARPGRRRQRPDPQPPAAPAAVQRGRRPGEGRLPSRLRHGHQPAVRHGLRPVRPRLPHGHLPQLLRAVGLHADGVRGPGRAGGHQRPDRLRRLRAAARSPTTPSRAWSSSTAARRTSISRTNDLADYLFNFVQLNRRQRIELRNRVGAAVASCSTGRCWCRHYNEAHDLAISRSGAWRSGTVEVRVV